MRITPDTRLLVSVRSASEARAALAGGCDVLDIKEPRRGPLGMADPEVIAEIVQAAKRMQPACPVSAALGELTEWTTTGRFPRLDPGLAYVKLGLAGTGPSAAWIEEFRRFQDGCRQFQSPTGDSSSHRAAHPQWIVATYADWKTANCPHPVDVLESLLALGAEPGRCAGMVLDTCDKTAGPLTEHLSTIELARLVSVARRSGLLLALAGKITVENLPLLCEIRPEILGVRSAVCRDGIRDDVVEESAVAELRRQIEAEFAKLADPGH